MDAFEKSKKFVVFLGWTEGALAAIYYFKGDHKKVEQILEEMIEQKRNIKQTSSFHIGIAAGFLEQLDLAFEFLDKAYEERDIMMTLIHLYTVWSPPSMTRGKISAAVVARRIEWIKEMLAAIEELPLRTKKDFLRDRHHAAAAESYLRRALEFSAKELSHGTLFTGRYYVIEELGKGGMGRVYKVLDKAIDEKIALKLLNPEIAADGKTIARFRNELRTARQISHKNICWMYHIGKDEGTHYITMERPHKKWPLGLLSAPSPASIITDEMAALPSSLALTM